MKIKVTAPLKSNEIQSLLDGYQQDDGTKIRFESRTGAILIFDIEGETNAEKAISKIKTIIKGTEFGKVLYFSVSIG